jgi:hypothetical protein
MVSLPMVTFSVVLFVVFTVSPFSLLGPAARSPLAWVNSRPRARTPSIHRLDDP